MKDKSKKQTKWKQKFELKNHWDLNHTDHLPGEVGWNTTTLKYLSQTTFSQTNKQTIPDLIEINLFAEMKINSATDKAEVG